MSNMNNKFVILLLVAALMHSCTGLEYGVATTSEGSELNFKFDFSAAYHKPDGTPENAMVLLSELVSDTRYFFDTRTGFSVSKENEFPISNGEYYILSISSKQDDYIFNGLESFEDPANPTAISAMQLEVKPMADEQVKEQYGPCFKGIASQFLTLPSVSPLYISIDSRVPVYFREPGEKITLSLKPVEMSVTLDFSVNIDLEPDIVVDSVFAGISGVPYKMMLMEGNVVKDTLGISFFKMTPDNGRYTGSGKYSGSVDTWGLFSADFGDYITGPGIFWVSIVASCADRSKVISAGLNIKEQIDEAELMNSADGGQTWKLALKKVAFPIRNNIHISKEMILSGGEDGVEGWITVEDEEHPIVIDM